jgi:molecular chaperone DnaK (HSP70)
MPRAAQRLKKAAEAAKVALSSQTSTRVVVPDLLPGAKLDVTVTREQFESACEDLFTLCIDTAKAVLE